MRMKLYRTKRKGLELALTIFQILGNDGDLGSGPPREGSRASNIVLFEFGLLDFALIFFAFLCIGFVFYVFY